MKNIKEEFKFCEKCSSYFDIFDYEDHIESHENSSKKENSNMTLEATICFAGPNVAKSLLNKLSVNKAVKNDPRYLLITQGINLLSKCSNVKCQSKIKNYRVYNQFGYSSISFPDIYDGDLKCQECGNVLDINDYITIVFCDCKYQWSGREKIKQNDKYITKVHKFGDWTTVKGVKKFNESDKENNWYSLEFNVDKLPKLSESIIKKYG